MLIHIASSRLLKKVALNTDAAVKKFVKDFINSHNNVQRIKDYIEQKCQPKWYIEKKEKIYNDNFVGTVEASFGIAGGEVTVELFKQNDFDTFIKNGIKDNLNIKDKFKSFFSNKAKNKIKDEVHKALMEYLKTHIDEFAKPYVEDVYTRGYIKGLYQEITKDETPIRDDKLKNSIRVRTSFDNGRMYIHATVPLFKINLNARNYLQKTFELSQEQIDKLYSGELQKVLKRWQVNDPSYFNQVKNYLTTSLQNIARQEQYKKMSGQ